MTIKNKLLCFLSNNIVFIIAVTLACISACFVGVDKQYLDYIDYKTITCLFCMLACICALKNIYFFRICARKIVKLFKTTRSAITAIVFITFFGSMLIANDMALITFLPLGFIALSEAKKEKYILFTFIMQNIAANLGGMLTPFGNPQNLFLYSFFNIPTAEFFMIMLVPFAVATAIIFAVCMFVKSEPLVFDDEINVTMRKPRLAIYLALFVFSIIIVFNIIPYWVGLIVIMPILAVCDYKALLKVDYALLLTFVAFFIFAGNIARIPAIKDFLSGVLNKNVLLFGTISCQFISNVPSAILLSQFTADYTALLRAVNIGGLGTLIASLASLITFKEFCAIFPKQKLKYVLWFSIANFSILGVLLITCIFI